MRFGYGPCGRWTSVGRLVILGAVPGLSRCWPSLSLSRPCHRSKQLSWGLRPHVHALCLGFAASPRAVGACPLSNVTITALDDAVAHDNGCHGKIFFVFGGRGSRGLRFEAVLRVCSFYRRFDVD